MGSGGGGGGDRSSKEAIGMMALHEALRNVCLNSDWTYSVFWTIRPRPRCRGGNGCKVGDDNGSLMLMWEDGFCRPRVAECLEEIDGEDPVRKAFSKMSIQLYNYGEGLMGKVASDKCHKWVFKEPSDQCEPSISNYWQSSFDALPPEWTDQFVSGIQTIAVIQAGHGLLQLGSCKIIAEDLHFVLRMRHTFESLGYQSGFFLSQLFTSTRTSSPSSSAPMNNKQTPTPPPPPPPIYFNWTHPPLPSTTQLIPPPNFHPSPHLGLPAAATATANDNTHLFLHRPSPMEEGMMMTEHEQPDIKWPNGLSFFTALTGRSDDAKLLFANDNNNNNKQQMHSNHHHHQEEEETGEGNAAEDYLGLESHSNRARKMDNNDSKFKRSFTMPAATSNQNQHQHQHQQHHGTPGPTPAPQGMEYRGSEAGIYSDIMETF